MVASGGRGGHAARAGAQGIGSTASTGASVSTCLPPATTRSLPTRSRGGWAGLGRRGGTTDPVNSGVVLAPTLVGSRSAPAIGARRRPVACPLLVQAATVTVSAAPFGATSAPACAGTVAAIKGAGTVARTASVTRARGTAFCRFLGPCGAATYGRLGDGLVATVARATTIRPAASRICPAPTLTGRS